jgi:hypothetical protein
MPSGSSLLSEEYEFFSGRFEVRVLAPVGALVAVGDICDQHDQQAFWLGQ